MADIGQVNDVAKGISENGFMVMTCAFYLLLTAMMMVTIFKWFKGIINQILSESREGMRDLLEETRKQNEMLYDLSEGLKTETQLRIRNITGFAFDLAVEQVCRLIKRVRSENHIADRNATAAKIRNLITNIHEDRKSRLDPFEYRGRRISMFCSKDWVEQVAKVVEGEIYNEQGADDARAYTNVKMVYDQIKLDFYHRLNQ